MGDDPRVLEDVGEGQAVVWPALEESPDEILRWK